MRRTIYQLSFVIIICSALTGCKNVFLGLYGMKMPKAVNEKKILRYGKKYHIPEEDSYRLDTTTYNAFLHSLDTSKFKAQIKNHYQPLQALYYDRMGMLKSFQINCYAGGFPNLHWNRDQIFETFLPKQQAPVDSILPLREHLSFLVPLSVTTQKNPSDTEYFAIVHWNRFMGRQTRRLIRCVQKNAKLSGDNQLKIIYVNNDNQFLDDL